MLIPTTPGRLDRVRARITTTPPTSERRVLRGSLLAALLATAAVALTGALAAPGAEAAPAPDGTRTYRVTADLDGRLSPILSDTVIQDFLRKGERVPIECQRYGGPAYGSRLWDLVFRKYPGDATFDESSATLWVPDRFIKTGTNGRSPDIRRCGKQDVAEEFFPEG
jgi:hypothetical protein